MRIEFSIQHVVFKYGCGYSGWLFDFMSGGFTNKRVFSGLNDFNSAMGYGSVFPPQPIVIDPLTAIGLNLVVPEELGLPPGMLAAFNLLKGN